MDFFNGKIQSIPVYSTINGGLNGIFSSNKMVDFSTTLDDSEGMSANMVRKPISVRWIHVDHADSLDIFDLKNDLFWVHVVDIWKIPWSYLAHQPMGWYAKIDGWCEFPQSYGNCIGTLW